VKNLCKLGCLLALLSSANGQTPLLRYSFDEASGDAVDSGSAPAANGTLNGGAVRSTNTPSGTGSSVSFLSESPYAYVLGPDGDKLDGLNQITLTTWLNLSSYTSGNNRLFSKQAATTFGGFSWNMNAIPNSDPVSADNFRLGLFLGNNVSAGANDFVSVFSNDDVGAADRWVFLAVTYNGTIATDNVRFYIGSPSTPVTLVGTPLTTLQLTIDAGSARAGVGFTDAAPTANTSAIGLQDDVRVYGTALDSAALDQIRLANLVPEPSTTLIAGGTLLLGACRRRRR
jgi:hypothetical protein